MKTLRDSKHWQFIEDPLMGATSIQHKTFEQLRTLWNTGYEADQEKKLIESQSDDEFILYCNLQTRHITIPLPF